MINERLVVGMLATNCYVVGCPRTRQGMVIDPGGDAEIIGDRVEELGLTLAWIVDTHGHGDHIEAQRALKERFPEAQIAIHPDDADCLADPQRNLSVMLGVPYTSPPADRLLNDGDDLTVGALTFKVLHTPGHTRGGVSLFCQPDDGDPVVFCGDTLFDGSIGRTDFPGGSMSTLLASIRERLFTLPPRTVCYTGHGEPTTIEREMRDNPFLT